MTTPSLSCYRIGRATVTVVPEHAGNPLPLDVVMPAITVDDLGRAGRWLDEPAFGATPAQSILTLSWHSYVIRIAGSTVLVDTGLGNDKTRPDEVAFAAHRATDLPGLLREAGLGLGDIDLVVCTHLHFDHVGWNTVLRDGQWVPTFPAARYVFPRADYEHFRAQAETDPVSGPAFRDSVEPVVQAGHAELVDPGHVLIDDGQDRLWLEDAAGHSPGSVLVRLRSGATEAVFSGDLLHHPVQLVRSGINLAMEHHPEAATATRDRLVAGLADTGVAVFPAHFTGSPAGLIRRDGAGYRWDPLPDGGGSPTTVDDAWAQAPAPGTVGA